jgi:hypothetical protein
MLAISTSPASAGASSSTWETTGSMASLVAEGSGLLSSDDARGSPVLVACCADFSTTPTTVGAGLRLLSVAPPPCPSRLLRPDPRGRTMESPAIQLSARNISKQELDYSFEELTSWEVVAVTFSFLATRFRATLRGLLGGAGRLASRLAGRCSMRGILGSPGQLNLDRNSNRSGSVSPSSSSEVSSMLTVSSPSPISWRSFALLLPSYGISKS